MKGLHLLDLRKKNSLKLHDRHNTESDMVQNVRVCMCVCVGNVEGGGRGEAQGSD